MTGAASTEWLLDSDPALRWQVERDLAGEPPPTWEATRARMADEGFGARLLALQDPDGQWAGGAFFPSDFDFHGPEAQDGAGQPWTATTWTLNALRDWGLDASVLRERRTAESLPPTVDGNTTICPTGAGRWTAASTRGPSRTDTGLGRT